jgi:Plasmid encoded RepA protein
MREWMGRMNMSVGGETAAALREQARRIATCTMRFTWRVEDRAGRRDRGPTMMTNERIIKSGLFFQDNSKGGPSDIPCLGPYDAAEGAIVCHDANSLRSRMSCWTSS